MDMESIQSFIPATTVAALGDGSTELASPVTVSGQHDLNSTCKSQDGNVTHTVTYTSERALSDSFKKPSSIDFAEQIRKLEVEGNKLRAATVSSLSNIGE